MLTAWQRPLGDLAEEKLVRFGRERSSITLSVVEDDRGFHVEARCNRRLVSRIVVGYWDVHFAMRLDRALRQALEEAQAKLAEALNG